MYTRAVRARRAETLTAATHKPSPKRANIGIHQTRQQRTGPNTNLGGAGAEVHDGTAVAVGRRGAAAAAATSGAGLFRAERLERVVGSGPSRDYLSVWTHVRSSRRCRVDFGGGCR